MNKLKNIIQKQILQFQYNGKTDGIALQKEVSDWCMHTLIPEIEMQLEPFALSDSYITVDEIEIDAAINRKDWQQELRNILTHQFSEKIKELKLSPAGSKLIEGTVLKRTDDLLIFYLNNGYLPWWSSALIKINFEATFNNWLEEEKDAARIEFIISQLRKTDFEKLQKRLIAVISPDLFFRFIAIHFANEKEKLKQTEQFLQDLLAGIESAKQDKVMKQVQRYILHSLLVNDRIDDEEMLFVFSSAFKKLVLVKHVSDLPKGKNPEAYLLIRLKEILNADAVTEIIPIKKQKRQNDKTRKEEKLIGGIYIENAGLVIIAAFLPLLFEKLKIAGNGKLLKPEQAICLIQFIATANEKINEHELVLSKILCGMNPEDPVDTRQRITGKQKKEIEAMLSSVIEHWAVLRNTSIQGLRESFLQRNGKLTFTDNEWHLQVEQKPFDMLLQRLPWNIGIIKLAWMNQIIKTEWI